jgi:uncharacterized protein with PIN domain
MRDEPIARDALTGRPIYAEHPDNEVCPKCGKHSWTGDDYHLAGKCRNPECGHTEQWDD